MKSSQSLIKENLAIKEKEESNKSKNNNMDSKFNSSKSFRPIKYSRETDVNFFKEKVIKKI